MNSVCCLKSCSGALIMNSSSLTSSKITLSRRRFTFLVKYSLICILSGWFSFQNYLGGRDDKEREHKWDWIKSIVRTIKWKILLRTIWFKSQSVFENKVNCLMSREIQIKWIRFKPSFGFVVFLLTIHSLVIKNFNLFPDWNRNWFFW